MITGPQIREARDALGWKVEKLASRAKVSASVVLRAEASSGEPAVTIVQMKALVQALREAGASFAPVNPAGGGEDAP